MLAQTSAAGDGYIGMSMPGWWRPFASNSPWNTPIPAGAADHPDSYAIIHDMVTRIPQITVRFANDYQATMHVVGNPDPTTQIPKYYYHSYNPNHNTNIYRFTHNENFWNPDANEPFDITDAKYPFIPGKTVPENTTDGRMTIIDVTSYPSYYAFEVSHGKKELDTCYPIPHAQCTTFNVWDLAGTGTVKKRPICEGGLEWPNCDDYWTCAGGRGAGVPIIAGIVRPEELELAVSSAGDGKIHHALSFCYDYNRCGPPLYPFAYRNDGTYPGNEYPIEGMLFQLRSNFPVNSIQNPYGRVIARTLKTYGAVLVDVGGGDSMSFNLQNLFTDTKTNSAVWEEKFPGFYDSITVINPNDFRVVNTPATLSANLLCDHAETCSCP